MRAKFWGLLRLAPVVGLAPVAGCDRIVGFEDLPPLASDAPDLPPRLACYGRSTPPAGPGEKIKLGLHFIEATGTDVAAPLSLDVCSTLDPTCAAPTASVVTATGDAVLVVPTSATSGAFFGQVRVRGEGYFPTSLMFRPAPGNDKRYPKVLAIGDAAINFVPPLLMVDAGLIGDRGHLLINAFGCDGAPLPGLYLDVPIDDADQNTVAFSREGTFVERDTTVTKSEGFSGVINIPIPAGQDARGLRARVVDAETGKLVNESAAEVRRGEATMIVLAP
jgi:hypothetical protein